MNGSDMKHDGDELPGEIEPQYEAASIGDLQEIHDASLEDLAQAGKILLSVREMTRDESLKALIPKWKWTRFVTAISNAACETIKAMDCLSRKESPTTESLIEAVISRWDRSPAREKDEIVSVFRAAFTRPKQDKTNGKAS